MWPESNAVVSKFYTCGLCGMSSIQLAEFCCDLCSGLSVHAECRDVALRCMPCSPGTAVHRKDKRILGKHWVNGTFVIFMNLLVILYDFALNRMLGRIVCQILQAYDLKISNGTYIVRA